MAPVGIHCCGGEVLRGGHSAVREANGGPIDHPYSLRLVVGGSCAGRGWRSVGVLEVCGLVNHL